MSSRESFSDWSSQSLQGPDAVRQGISASTSFGDAQWLSDDEKARLCVVVEELVANLYDHGGLSDTDVVDVSFKSTDEGIRIRIVDRGKAFDPRTAPSRLRTDQVGGSGIDLVRAWAIFVDYSPSEDGNRLEILLPLRWEG